VLGRGRRSPVPLPSLGFGLGGGGRGKKRGAEFADGRDYSGAIKTAAERLMPGGLERAHVFDADRAIISR